MLRSRTRRRRRGVQRGSGDAGTKRARNDATGENNNKNNNNGEASSDANNASSYAYPSNNEEDAEAPPASMSTRLLEAMVERVQEVELNADAMKTTGDSLQFDARTHGFAALFVMDVRAGRVLEVLPSRAWASTSLHEVAFRTLVKQVLTCVCAGEAASLQLLQERFQSQGTTEENAMFKQKRTIAHGGTAVGDAQAFLAALQQGGVLEQDMATRVLRGIAYAAKRLPAHCSVCCRLRSAATVSDRHAGVCGRDLCTFQRIETTHHVDLQAAMATKGDGMGLLINSVLSATEDPRSGDLLYPVPIIYVKDASTGAEAGAGTGTGAGAGTGTGTGTGAGTGAATPASTNAQKIMNVQSRIDLRAMRADLATLLPLMPRLAALAVKRAPMHAFRTLLVQPLLQAAGASPADRDECAADLARVDRPWMVPPSIRRFVDRPDRLAQLLWWLACSVPLHFQSVGKAHTSFLQALKVPLAARLLRVWQPDEEVGSDDPAADAARLGACRVLPSRALLSVAAAGEAAETAEAAAPTAGFEQPTLMFHGSQGGNWFSILRRGWANLSNTEHMRTGAMLGPGVYFGDSWAVSLAYTKGAPQVVAVCRAPPDLTGTNYKDFGWAVTVQDASAVRPVYLCYQ